MRDFYLWIIILTLVLAFALYNFFFPNALEFFANQGESANDREKEEDTADE